MAGIFNGLIWLIFWSVVIVVSLGGALVLFIPYLFLTFAGAAKRQEKADENLSTVLMDTEVIASKATQTRIFSLWSRRTLVAITNSRLLVLQRGIFGGCLLYTSPSPRDQRGSRMPSSA